MRMKNKRLLAAIMCICMTTVMLGGCGRSSKNENGGELAATDAAEETTQTDSSENEISNSAGSVMTGDVQYMDRPMLVDEYVIGGFDEELVPSVPVYSVHADFSDVINGDMLSHATDDFKRKLANNLFVVGGENGREFYETYEFNSYSQTPNFVTVDSMMHTYHLYFAYLLKTCEKTYLSDAMRDLSTNMYDMSLKHYEELKGTDWEKAAAIETEYFAVACELLGSGVSVPGELADAVDMEVQKIEDADNVFDSAIFDGLMEDYSQYKPRGYYEGDAKLESYFRTMMWFGRMGFPTDNEDALKASLLVTIGLKEAGDENWNSVYAVTSFFAGASDDMGYCEYLPIAQKAYGEIPDTAHLISDTEGFESFTKLVSQLPSPQIQSVPVYVDEDNVVKTFRFMGQRFTIDGNIMQNLIYRAVDMNEDGQARMLPDVMDVPAAMGSKTAKEIAFSNGADAFPDYEKQLNKVMNDLSASPESIWTSNLYSQWLNTLRPLLDEKGSGYPTFMQNKEWTKKTLETFAGSYTELKHDTVLYAKQPMAEMGGGWEEDIDDRGYVEPEPEVFHRFAQLSQATSEGLRRYHMISNRDAVNLQRLSELAVNLMIIAQKELRNELCTNDEYDLIRNYGGNIEHFWHEALKNESDSEYFTSEEYPAALVIDVATDPNGTVLEAGTGNPREIYVIVPVDGKLRIATGSVYNFYQFAWPLSDRLTDSKWREMIGAMPGEGYIYERDDSMDNPDWTKSYRAVYYDYSMYEW